MVMHAPGADLHDESCTQIGAVAGCGSEGHIVAWTVANHL